MEAFWVALVKPFMALAMLMAAWPFKRAVELWMPDRGPLKQFLLKRRGDAIQHGLRKQIDGSGGSS